MTAPTEFLRVPSEDPEALLEWFCEQGWGDGLPVIAPTPQRVARMLDEGAPGCDPDEVIAVLEPRRGEATRRAIAANAVLAGCRPAQLPVLVSAVRALAQPELNLRGVNATTHPVAPLLIVHGEIVGEAGFNAGAGTFGPGNRANATTGRAIRLILMHLAGALPGPGDASTQGGPAKYGYCAAESSGSPWPSYAAWRGIDAPSAVTIHCGEAPHNVHDMEHADPQTVLGKVASAMTSLGQNNACISQGEYFVLLCPEHAASIAAAGWGRAEVAEHLWRSAGHRADELRRHFHVVAWEPWMNDAPDEQWLPMTATAENIRVVVVGGAGKHSSVVPSWGMTRSVTMAVEP